MTKIGITERGDAAIHYDEWRQKLDQVEGAILITKNPCELLDKLQRQEFDFRKCIIHCTITGWGGTLMEPGVPPTHMTVPAYKELVKVLGPERVVLRVDPIIQTAEGMSFADMLMQLAQGRVRVSFLDTYKHVYYRFRSSAPRLYQDLLWLNRARTHTPLSIRKRMLKKLEEKCAYTLEVCGEPGMNCSGCISARDLLALGLQQPQKITTSKQRKACACLAMKTELLTHRGQCKHGCLYCYWR